MADPTALDGLAQEVLKGKNFRWIDSSLAATAIQTGLQSNEKPKERIARARSKLHQVCNAFRANNLDYSALINQIQSSETPVSETILRENALAWMQLHASTRERTPILEEFYREIFSKLPQIHSILDLASGLNPLALPWMDVKPDVQYLALDVYADMANLLNVFFAYAQYPNGHAIQGNLLEGIPAFPADLTLLLKTIPCLEQLEKTAGRKILDQIQSRHAVVSFPIFSLSGRQKGMNENYETHFFEICDSEKWEVERLSFKNELVFLLTQRGHS